MNKIFRFGAIAAAAALALSLGACSKDEPPEETESVAEVAQSAEEADVDGDAEAAEQAEETAEVASEYPEFTEGEGVGPAYLNAGYVAFEVGEDMKWSFAMSEAMGDSSAKVIFKPTDDYRLISVGATPGPGWVNSMEDAAEECLSSAGHTDLEVEDLGEVEINGVTYYKLALHRESGPPQLELCTFHEPSGSFVGITADGADEGSYDFAFPEVMDLLFDTLTIPEK